MTSQWGLAAKGHKETLWGDRNILISLFYITVVVSWVNIFVETPLTTRVKWLYSITGNS